MARMGAYKVDDDKKSRRAVQPKSTFREITDDSVEDDYEHNVWRAIEDMWVEMYASYDMSNDEIKDKIMFLVDAYIQFMESEAQKDLHKMSSEKRRQFK